MKKLVVISFLLALTLGVRAQQSTFESAITDALNLADSAKTIDDIHAVTQRFERIAMAESNRWEPLYHQAYYRIIASFYLDGDKQKDAALDNAQKSIDKAIELKGDLSELYTLQAFLYQARISVSPMRGMTYSQKAAEAAQKALQQNDKNPRAHYVLAQNVYHTPAMFGGGSSKALPHYKRAADIFANGHKDAPAGPRWGRRSSKEMVEKCEKE